MGWNLIQCNLVFKSTLWNSMCECFLTYTHQKDTWCAEWHLDSLSTEIFISTHSKHVLQILASSYCASCFSVFMHTFTEHHGLLNIQISLGNTGYGYCASCSSVSMHTFTEHHGLLNIQISLGTTGYELRMYNG